LDVTGQVGHRDTEDLTLFNPDDCFQRVRPDSPQCLQSSELEPAQTNLICP